MPAKVLALIGLLAAIIIPSANPLYAAGPGPDSYEANDAEGEAALIPASTELGSLSIAPAGDADWFRLLPSPGKLVISALGMPGLDLTLTLTGPGGSILASHNQADGPSATLTYIVPSESWHLLSVTNENDATGYYVLRVTSLPATATLAPTPTIPAATATPLPGALPDITEPSYDFAHAYRIASGDTLVDLNFNAGQSDWVDNDFFVMAVRAGVSYTCETGALGPGLDTNLIAYSGPDSSLVIGGNDDVDASTGQIASRLTVTPVMDGDIYLLVGYKYPQPNDIRYPGDATYSFSCQVVVPPAPPIAPGPITRTASSITRISTPAASPAQAPDRITPSVVNVLVGYDRNGNDVIDPAEGVSGLSVLALDRTNHLIGRGSTDSAGRLTLVLPYAGELRLSLPYLGASKVFRPGSDIIWSVLIPAVSLPGLIP